MNKTPRHGIVFWKQCILYRWTTQIHKQISYLYLVYLVSLVASGKLQHAIFLESMINLLCKTKIYKKHHLPLWYSMTKSTYLTRGGYILRVSHTTWSRYGISMTTSYVTSVLSYNSKHTAAYQCDVTEQPPLIQQCNLMSCWNITSGTCYVL